MTLANKENPVALNAPRYDALPKIMDQASELALMFFHKRRTLVIAEKSQRDFVSDADRAVEQEILGCIKSNFPDDDVVGEELGGQVSEKYWIIDPIDGTSNFLSGLPIWGISVAYVVNGQPLFGAISIPVLDEVIVGHTELGLAQSSNKVTLGHASPLVFGVGRNGMWDAQKRVEVEHGVEQRGYYPINIGSCAVSLAFCATGRLAGYIEEEIGFWDCAAGVALCNAVGLDVEFDVGQKFTSAQVHCWLRNNVC